MVYLYKYTHMRIAELLAEGYPDTVAAFSQAADPVTVKKTVDAYRDLVTKNQVSGTERNIDWWRQQGWPAFKDFVDEKSTQATKTQVKRKAAAGKSIVLKDTPEWLVVIPLDHDASCFHGRGSDWCTARPTAHYFDSYFLDQDIVLIYCINKTTGNKYAIASHRDHDETELFNMKDETISAAEFQQATGFDPESLIKLIPHDDARISVVKQKRKELLRQTGQQLDAWQNKSDHKRHTELEQLLIASKNPRYCAEYVYHVGVAHGAQKFPIEIITAAVNDESDHIQYQIEPSPGLQMIAVKNQPRSIKYIQNPSESVQIHAASLRPESTMKYLIKIGVRVSAAVQLAAMKQDVSTSIVEKLLQNDLLAPAVAALFIDRNAQWGAKFLAQQGWQFVDDLSFEKLAANMKNEGVDYILPYISRSIIVRLIKDYPVLALDIVKAVDQGQLLKSPEIVRAAIESTDDSAILQRIILYILLARAPIPEDLQDRARNAWPAGEFDQLAAHFKKNKNKV